MSCDATTRSKALRGVALACGAMLLLGGCSKASEREAPPIYPVTGTLVLESGANPEHATIEFVPQDGSKALSALGIADAEGKFTLSVPYPDRQLPGAAAGVYRAVVMMPLKPDRSVGERYELQQEFVVEPQSNHFELVVPASRK